MRQVGHEIKESFNRFNWFFDKNISKEPIRRNRFPALAEPAGDVSRNRSASSLAAERSLTCFACNTRDSTLGERMS